MEGSEGEKGWRGNRKLESNLEANLVVVQN